jgi:rhodanese-related sulfurtransferase
MDFEELRQRVEDGDTSCVLLNVLTRAAFEAGRIPSSVNLPVGELAERAAEVLPAPEQETVAYCASSSCSLAAQAVALLRNLGYTNVREYHGGMEEWIERGGRIERAESVAQAVVVSEPTRMDRVVARLSPVRAFRWATEQPLPVLFGIWFATTIVFTMLYWATRNGAIGLSSGGQRMPQDLGSLVTAFAFSIATALSSGYGDVVAVGAMRLAVLLETAAGLVLFSAIVSKILGRQQEEVLGEIHRVTFENRLGRVRTNLHLVLSDLAEISRRCSDTTMPQRRMRGRIESVAMIFAGELAAARDLLRGRSENADDRALEALFACFAAGLEELGDLLTCLVTAQDKSGSLRRSLRSIAQLGGDLCGASTRQTPSLCLTLDRVQRLCRALSDELRPGDAAPRFALLGSDGKMHRLADHFGRSGVVLLWFPKAFTGG